MKDLIWFVVYFCLSTVITWVFVVLCPLYINQEQMLLSTSIAGGKWAIQIVLALAFAGNDSMKFLRKIGFVCFIGSCILMPYVVSALCHISNSGNFFFASLIASVLTMIFFYYKAVRELKFSLKWWVIWLVCLTVAISLQLTVVFHYISFR